MQTNPLAKIDYGRDFNFFQRITVIAGSFQPNCDMVITFPTYTVSFQLESGTTVLYSFNGNVTHGDMISGKSSASLIFENRSISKIWFAGNGVVRVEAWAPR